ESSVDANGPTDGSADETVDAEEAAAEADLTESGDLVFSNTDRAMDGSSPLFERSGSSVDSGGFAMLGAESQREIRDRLDGMTQTLATSMERVLYSAPMQSVFPSLRESLALLNDAQYSTTLAKALESV